MVLAATGFLALSLLYMESVRLPAVTGRVVADLAFLIPLFSSVILCLVALRRSRGVEARFWLVASALNAVLLFSELYWLGIVVSQGSPPPPIYSPFQALHTMAALLFVALLATMVRLADTPAPMQARWWLDLSAAAAVVYVVALRAFVEPVFAHVPQADAITHLIAAVYTAGGAMILGGGLWILVRPGVMRWRLWERLIAVSVMIYAAGTMLWPIWFAAFTNGGTADERSLPDLVLVLGNYLFVIAAAERLLNSEQAWPMRRLGPARTVAGRTTTNAVLAVSVVALPVLVTAAVLAPAASLDRGVYAVAAAVIALLMVGRTIVSAVENGRLFHSSVSDPLTGLYNHRYFHERLATEIGGAERYGETVAVMWLDVDDLSHLNRVAGHQAGDDVLRLVADTLAHEVGDTAVVCRVGGDKFAVIARGMSADAAVLLAGRIEASLASTARTEAAASVSGGIAVYPASAVDPVQLARIAERTAQVVRRFGKGHIRLHEPVDAEDQLAAEEGPYEIEERSRIGTLRALATAVDARREVSGARASAVAALAAALARELGVDEGRVKQIETAALVHDIGMVALTDEVLDKAGPLDTEETAALRSHPALAARIIGQSEPSDATGRWIRHHHERWDGAGYPDGLRAVAIPLEARIIGICDAWAAMVSERPYRRAMTTDEAIAELRACSGQQFDPSLVEPLIVIVGSFRTL